MSLYDEPLSITHPNIAAEWSEKNAPFTPDDVTAGSHERVWWKGKCGHEWQTGVGNRTIRNTGCPYCTTRTVLKGFNDLATLRPDLAAEWSDRNGDLKPDSVRPGCNKKVWWKCKKGHEWKAVVNSRSRGNGCRICSNQVCLKGFNDLATRRPDLASEWSEKNLPLTPDNIIWTKQGSFWWKCPKCGNEYKAWLLGRMARNSACPYCAGFKVKSGYNDLKTTDPEIAMTWDYKANGTLLPEDFFRTSLRFVKWKCCNGHSYGMKIRDRTVNGKGCVICDISFRAYFSELLLLLLAKREGVEYELDSEYGDVFLSKLNLAFEIEGVSIEKQKLQLKKKRSIKKRGIDLIIVSRVNDLKKASANVRNILKRKGIVIKSDATEDIELLKKEFYGKDYRDAPYEGGGAFKDVIGGYVKYQNEAEKLILPLNETNPELISEWSEKNFPFKPEDEEERSCDKVWWKCKKCGCEWKSLIRNRAELGKGCPVCGRKKVVKGINDIATTDPEVAAEWSPRNGSQKPEHYSRGSNQKVWWRCKNGHEWKTSISNRTLSQNGCPICARAPVVRGINDLKTTNPEIVKFWSTKNGSLMPEDIRATYRKQVWWKCDICGYEYLAQPHTVIKRAREGCPRCQTSIGRGWKDLLTDEEKIKEEYR